MILYYTPLSIAGREGCASANGGSTARSGAAPRRARAGAKHRPAPAAPSWRPASTLRRHCDVAHYAVLLADVARTSRGGVQNLDPAPFPWAKLRGRPTEKGWPRFEREQALGQSSTGLSAERERGVARGPAGVGVSVVGPERRGMCTMPIAAARAAAERPNSEGSRECVSWGGERARHGSGDRRHVGCLARRRARSGAVGRPPKVLRRGSAQRPDPARRGLVHPSLGLS